MMNVKIFQTRQLHSCDSKLKYLEKSLPHWTSQFLFLYSQDMRIEFLKYQQTGVTEASLCTVWSQSLYDPHCDEPWEMNK